MEYSMQSAVISLTSSWNTTSSSAYDLALHPFSCPDPTPSRRIRSKSTQHNSCLATFVLHHAEGLPEPHRSPLTAPR
eukprot:3882470-Rhodomonas_salina.1